MKFICTKDNLLTGLSRVTPLAGRNAQLPILQHILLQLRDGVLHLTGTDLELGVHTIVPGKVERDGSCTVPARKLNDYIQHVPATHPLQLELKDTVLHITTKGFTAEFPTLPEDDFPLLPTAEVGSEVVVDAGRLCQALTRTVFAAARDDTRPEIHSVYVVSDGMRVRLAATDSFRLAEEVLMLEEEHESFSFLLPLAAAQETIRLFNTHSKITLLPRESHIAFHGESLELSSRLIDGKYPDYQQIIPASFKTSGQLERDAVVRALKTLLVFLPRDSRRVRMKVMPEKGIVHYAVSGSDAGAGEVEVPFTGTGEPIEILFNIQYLLEGIQSLTSKECVVELVGPTDPALFRPVTSDEDEQYRYVVMPIQA